MQISPRASIVCSRDEFQVGSSRIGHIEVFLFTAFSHGLLQFIGVENLLSLHIQADLLAVKSGDTNCAGPSKDSGIGAFRGIVKAVLDLDDLYAPGASHA